MRPQERQMNETVEREAKKVNETTFNNFMQVMPHEISIQMLLK